MKKGAPARPQLRGVIYARYSSHNQKEESIEQQIEECTAFAKANHITILEIYADKAISGRTDDRRSFQRMIHDAGKGLFDVVVAYKSNRIARNMLNALQYESKLEKFGVQTFYAKEEFGNTAAGRFALRNMMNINQFYSENLSEDVKRGMRDNAENCKINGRIPYGYKRGEDGKYAVNPEAAAVVSQVFDRISDNWKLTDIAADLNTRGIKTAAGKQWNCNSVSRIARSIIYSGVYKYADITIEGGVPAIVSREVFDMVQNKISSGHPTRGRKQHTGEYLLTGKLFCGLCGSLMTGMSGKGKSGAKYHYYACCGHRGGDCPKKHVSRDEIEAKVVEIIQKYAMSDEAIEWIAAGAVAIQVEATNDNGLQDLQSRMAEAKQKRANIVGAIEDGLYSPVLRERMEALEEDIKNIEREITKVKVLNHPAEHSRIVYFLESMREGSPSSFEYRKAIIDTFVRAVYLWDDHIEIDCYYDNDKIRKPLKKAEKNPPSDSPSGAGACVRIGSDLPYHSRKSQRLPGFFIFPAFKPLFGLLHFNSIMIFQVRKLHLQTENAN